MDFSETKTALQARGLTEQAARQWAASLTDTTGSTTAERIDTLVNVTLPGARKLRRERRENRPELLTTPEERFR